MNRISLFLAVVLCFALAAGCASAPAVRALPSGLSTLDGQAATFDPTTLQKPTLVVFWGSWCVPCNKEAPRIMALSKELSGQLDVLGVNVDTESEDAAGFVAKYAIDFPNIHDPELSLSDALGVEGTPSLILYAAGGEELARGRALEELKLELGKVAGK